MATHSLLTTWNLGLMQELAVSVARLEDEKKMTSAQPPQPLHRPPARGPARPREPLLCGEDLEVPGECGQQEGG